ncbi:(d)CMP kinase [Periweissella cryptocerci]|uniref:Cytidylate kinase n=1 Tax=Periweissella cryptocerci TaxID=2506420 RepID=A0A4P6YWM4_9LACO|nr:(d)CMP kinase [Periweissella cryptocerci]QBO37309.1 (d)CMP kinase [Periweissella cryptocerci]
MTDKMQVAIDGPASAGKSTIAKIIAKEFGYIYVDTGAMYRTITLAAMRAGLIVPGQETVDEAAVTALLPKTLIGFTPDPAGQRVFLNDEDVSEAIRHSDVNGLVSMISAIPAVRTDLVKRQRDIAASASIVMDGRDIGTTVLPDAQVKIFLVASVEERAARRFKENQEKGIDTNDTLSEIEASIARRDYLDSHREVSPLVQAADAQLVDTTGIDIPTVSANIASIINEKLK